MSSSKCARCDKTVYPVEGLRCLDKIWHKGCFKCHECNMTLNMKNYKGFEKRPYCNAHCPQAKATTVADTPEIRRLAENTRIQSQAKYHEDFEKSKGKNFTPIADDPEIRRVKETSKIISNASYHGDSERKRHMEEKRNTSAQEEVPKTRISSNQNVSLNNNNNNNNNVKHQNRMPSNNNTPSFDHPDLAPSHQAAQQQKQYHLMQQQQIQMKQQYQQQQPSINRQSSAASMDEHHVQEAPQKTGPRHTQQLAAYPPSHQQQMQLQLQQQQMLMRQQQQQQQIIMQQHRQSMDASISMPRQVSKQALISGTDHAIMKQPNMIRGHPQQQQLKYMPLNEPINGQPIPQHLMGVQPHMINQMGPGSGASQQHQHRRPVSNSHPQQQHTTQQNRQPQMQGYSSHQMNGAMPKHLVAQMSQMQLAPHMIQHPDQLHTQQRVQMRPNTIADQPMAVPHQGSRRVFRAMFDYMANDLDEVSFFEHDIIVDCVNVDRNWLIGKVARTGATGMLPANYVELLPSQ